MNNQPDNAPRLTISMWRDVKTDAYYALPNGISLLGTDVTIRNCLTLELQIVKEDELKPYLVSEKTAIKYLIKEIEHLSSQLPEYISHVAITEKNQTDRYQQMETALGNADWTQILGEYLDLTPSQIEDYPELFEKKLHLLLRNFFNGIGKKETVSSSDRTLAQTEAVKIQNALANNNINIGNALELLLSYLGYLHLSEESTNPDIEALQLKIAKIKGVLESEKNLEDAIRTIAENEELWSGKNSSLFATDTMEERVHKSLGKAMDEMESEHPLPSFSFEDLLADEAES